MSLLRKPFISGVIDSSRAVMRVLYTFSCKIFHMLLSTGFKSGEFEGHDSAAGVGGSFSDSACFFLNSRYLTLYLINLCDMCDMRLWVIDLADELLNCCESAVMEFGGLCQERLQCCESGTICRLKCFSEAMFPLSSKTVGVVSAMRAYRAGSAAACSVPGAS